MAVIPGTKLGPYEVVSPLGAGGMGEVYRAHDSRLGRDVAIKALPAGFASDGERLARFEREARLLASLSHPNIGAIFGLEDVAGTPYLVLELVEGETLGQRLARGPLTVRETLEIGGQIASAIEAAHERGIVHRDLKPGNIMLTASRVAKVLDFGLARGDAVESSSSPQLSATPTVMVHATGEGIILGTAPYMSPEQARGRSVDRRSDVWAFGCILFECLGGRPAFAGDTVSDVVARILEREPDWTALPPSVPPRLTDVVRRCLAKELTERPRDIGDLHLQLNRIAQELSAAPVARTATDMPSLAVLYFENLSTDQESGYFCAGITEDILTDLSKIKGLRVASRNAVARYRGTGVDIARVGAELQVKSVLEGSVRRVGDRVRITAQLINVADGFHLWAERYDRTLEDVFAVQEEIASSIAGALRVALTPAESKNLVQDRPNDVRAYDLYLKGRELYGRYNAESLKQALEVFQQATSIDPAYALGWAGIADCYGQMHQWGSSLTPDELTRLGLEAARKAIQLNPRLPEAHKAEALVLRFAGDLAGSRAALARAIDADPSFTPALINLAVDSFAKANVAAAERFVRRAIEVDPQEGFGTGWLHLIFMFTGRNEEALATAARIRQISDQPLYITLSHVDRAMVHLRRGDVAAAKRAVSDGRAEGAEATNLGAVEAAIAAAAGQVEASRAIAELETSRELVGGSRVLLAEASVRMGEVDRAARIMSHPLVWDLAPTMIRLTPGLHPLMDQEPFAPRRSSHALVWPVQAPMIDPVVLALFREVRIESGMPEGSDLGQREPRSSP